MGRYDKDDLGDRMKYYERYAGERFMPMLPICARLDGKRFSKFTRGLERPFDARLSKAMVELTRYLVTETGALVGYTQSDEISLIFHSEEINSQVYFDGRIQKMIGDLAAMATLRFNKIIADLLPPEYLSKEPRFDCRCWQVPRTYEAANSILWRELDATKNSVSMAASHYYSPDDLHGVNSAKRMEMLMEKGVNWNDYPAFFKRGTFIQKTVVNRKPTTEELQDLPEKHHARQNPDLVIERSVTAEVEMPPFSKVTNRTEVIFEGATPETAND